MSTSEDSTLTTAVSGLSTNPGVSPSSVSADPVKSPGGPFGDVVGVLHWTLTGGVTGANDVMLSLLGYTRDDLQAGRINWFDSTPQEWRAADADGMVQVRETGRHAPFEKEFFHKDGHRVRVLIGSTLRDVSRGEGISFIIDVSHARAFDPDAGPTPEERVAGVLESINDAFVALDGDWRVVYMNREAERLVKRHRNEFLGRVYWDAWPATQNTIIEQEYRRVAETGEPAQFECPYDGNLRLWLEVRVFRREGGGINAFFRDLTELRTIQEEQVSLRRARELSENSRRASERYLRFIADAAPMLIGYIDADEVYRFASAQYERWMNRPLAEIVNRSVRDVLGEVAYEKAEPYVTRALQGESVSYEAEMVYFGGARFVHVQLAPDIAENGRVRGFVGLVSDVSERKRVEQERATAQTALRHSETEVRNLVAHARCLLWQGRVSLGKESGPEANEMPLMWDVDVADKNAAQAFFALDLAPDQTYNNAWYWARLPEDRERTNRVSRAAILGGQSEYVTEFGARDRKGELRWFSERVSIEPLPREAWRLVGVCVETTERRQAELALREAQAAKTEVEQRVAQQQQRFVREMLYSVTEGRLRLCNTTDDLPPTLPDCDPTPVLLAPGRARVLKEVRNRVEAAARVAGLATERLQDLATAATEAATNAIKHAQTGEAWACVDAQAGTVQVWIQDRGHGIAPDSLHRATLERGFSSAGTLGHGFWLMLKTCDRVYLLSGADGTTVVLEQDREAANPLWM